MAQQQINYGTVPGDATGDILFDAFKKANDNFNELYSLSHISDHTLLSNIGTNTHAQIDTALSNGASHIADSTIHFAQSAISITESQISDLGSYLPLAGGTITGDVIFNDAVKAIYGTDSDGSIEFDGLDLLITSPTAGGGITNVTGGFEVNFSGATTVAIAEILNSTNSSTGANPNTTALLSKSIFTGNTSSGGATVSGMESRLTQSATGGNAWATAACFLADFSRTSIISAGILSGFKSSDFLKRATLAGTLATEVNHFHVENNGVATGFTGGTAPPTVRGLYIEQVAAAPYYGYSTAPTHTYGIDIKRQTRGTTRNVGIRLFGDGLGSDILFGAGDDCRLGYDGTNQKYDILTSGTHEFTGGNIQIDANDIQTDTTTGTKIGTSTGQKLGFWNTTPVDQPAALTASMTSITVTALGTPDYAIRGVANSFGQGVFGNLNEVVTFINVVQNMQIRLNELESRVQETGLVA